MIVSVAGYRCFREPVQFQVRPGFVALVGPNNGGKSSLLKLFFELRRIFEALRHDGSAFESGRDFSSPFDSNVFHKNGTPTIKLGFTFEEDEARVEGAESVQFEVEAGHFSCSLSLVIDGRRHVGNEAKARVSSLQGPNEFCRPSAFFGMLAQSMFLGPFRHALNGDGPNPYFDCHVGRQLARDWKEMKSGRDSTANERAEELERIVADVFGFARVAVNIGDEEEFRVVVEGKAYRIDEIGAGFSQVLIALVNAVVRPPSFVLIDEPETGLHASLQSRFLATLARHSKQAAVLFATHSLGLARVVAEKIYVVKGGANGATIEPYAELQPRDLIELIGALNFAGQRVVGVERILLVEGVTDVLVMREFLRRYEIEHRYLVLPLGGTINGSSNMVEFLNEIGRFAPNVAAIVDSERDRADSPVSESRVGFSAACDRVGIKCHVLHRRATENYFTEAAVRKVIGPSARALTPFEELKKVSGIGWPKSRNWSIAAKMGRRDLDETDLGKFLLSLTKHDDSSSVAK